MRRVSPFLLFAILLFFGVPTLQAQKLVAHYPMDQTMEDIVGHHPHLIMPNAHYQGGGIYTEGVYGNSETRNYVHATSVSALDYQEFAVSMEIKSPTVKRMNVFTINRSYRLIGCYVDDEGWFTLKMNNGRFKKRSNIQFTPNAWYHIAISYNHATQTCQLYINKELAVVAEQPLKTEVITNQYVGKDISTIDYSNAQAFKGVCKNLKVINGPYDPKTESTISLQELANETTTRPEGTGSIPRFSRGQGIQELDAQGFRELAKHGTAFINFAQPTCDLAAYYLETIEEINAELPDIPIYSFNKELYPEITKEFDLSGAQFLAKMDNGNFVGHYEGYRGNNLMKAWVITEWNKDKGTNIPVPNYRKTHGSSNQPPIDVASIKNYRYTFTQALEPTYTKDYQFRISDKQAKLVGGTLKAEGEYFSSEYTRTPSITPMNNFTLYTEFMPLVTQYNNVLIESGRGFGIVIQKGKLTFLFENGDFGYVAEEVDIKPLKWYSLAVSYEHSTSTLQVIVNGKRLDDFVISREITPSNYLSSFTITDFGRGEVYHGFLDDITIYTKALKDRNLDALYKKLNTGTSTLRNHLPGPILGKYTFRNHKNDIDKKESFNLVSDVSFLTNGHLKLSNQFKNSPIIETDNLPGLNPENTTIMLDFYEEPSGEKYARKLFSLNNTYSKTYASAHVVEGEIEIRLHYYVRKWTDRSINFKTQHLNLQTKRWYNLAVSFNERNKNIIVMIDGKEVLNKSYTTSMTPHKSTDLGRIVFQKNAYGPTAFSGFIDNLTITRSALDVAGMKKLVAGIEDHGSIGTVVSPSPVSNSVHSQQLDTKLHEWGYDDYGNFTFDKFSRLAVIQQPINLRNFDQALLNACIFYHTNQQRKKHGRPLLKHEPALEKAATMHSNDMADKEFFDHTNPFDRSKATPHQRIQYFGLDPDASSENIASRYERNISYWYLAELLVRQWMDSPPHRRNLLDQRLNHLGCGVMFSQSYGDELGGNFMATQNFAMK